MNKSNNPNKTDISCLFYKGMSLLRYSIQLNLNLSTIEFLLSENFCSRELITIKDPVLKIYIYFIFNSKVIFVLFILINLRPILHLKNMQLK